MTKKKQVSLLKTPLMEFLCDVQDLEVIPQPIAAGKRMPQWFKDIKPLSPDGGRDQFGAIGMTAKRCLPIMDALGLGFILPLWGDVNIRTSNPGEEFQFIEIGGNALGQVADFHGPGQLGGNRNKLTAHMPAVKWINRIVVKTAPGYSTLFIPPLASEERRFTCLPGLVDTDVYPKQVNFPAVWHAMGHDDIVKAGTPLVLCIPIKRDDVMNPDSYGALRAMTKTESKQIEVIARKQDSRRHVYTQELRESRK